MNIPGVSEQEMEVFTTFTRQISIESMRSYMDENGWELRREKPGVLAIYVKDGHHAVMPLNTSFTDYDDAVIDFVGQCMKGDADGVDDLAGLLAVVSQLCPAFGKLVEAEMADVKEGK